VVLVTPSTTVVTVTEETTGLVIAEGVLDIPMDAVSVVPGIVAVESEVTCETVVVVVPSTTVVSVVRETTDVTVTLTPLDGPTEAPAVASDDVEVCGNVVTEIAVIVVPSTIAVNVALETTRGDTVERVLDEPEEMVLEADD